MTSGIVFDIAHYSIYDGPGIRTTVFFKGCPLRCAWCHNPESWKKKPEIGYLPSVCTGCGTCRDVCPAGAVAVVDGALFRDSSTCRVCGRCVDACPSGALEVIGGSLSTDDVLREVLVDLPFYEDSGGGVTVSGGEATMQPIFLVEVLTALKHHGIHTALETCGFFDASLVRPLDELVDLFLFDIKSLDTSRHREMTGVGIEKIIDNFTSILTLSGSSRIIPRIPIIPGFNADDDSIHSNARFLSSVEYTGPVHCMPYNTMAKSKYEKVGRADLYRDMGILSEDRLERISRIFTDAGFVVVINE
ncbi:MAG: glycyl-radical enzyme activating protein [Deltaproteobacteria bacterium]|nr:glycyl-radical enzyme activating protein [Candidatus Zymogenaceae bacterium]